MRFKKRAIAVVGSAAAIAAMGSTAAFAYFTSTGSGTGSATVGSNVKTLDVKQTSSSGTIYPGGTGETLTFTITNSGKGDESYASATASVNGDTSTPALATTNGTADPGCQAGWFNAAVTSPDGSGTSIPSGGTATVTVQVTMPTADVDQSKCEGVKPDVTLTLGNS